MFCPSLVCLRTLPTLKMAAGCPNGGFSRSTASGGGLLMQNPPEKMPASGEISPDDAFFEYMVATAEQLGLELQTVYGALDSPDGTWSGLARGQNGTILLCTFSTPLLERWSRISSKTMSLARCRRLGQTWSCGLDSTRACHDVMRSRKKPVLVCPSAPQFWTCAGACSFSTI